MVTNCQFYAVAKAGAAGQAAFGYDPVVNKGGGLCCVDQTPAPQRGGFTGVRGTLFVCLHGFAMLCALG